MSAVKKKDLKVIVDGFDPATLKFVQALQRFEILKKCGLLQDGVSSMFKKFLQCIWMQPGDEKALMPKVLLRTELPPLRSVLLDTDELFLKKYVKKHDDKEVVAELMMNIFTADICFLYQKAW
ncbi:unnamed protein product [Brassica rapa]|uniref:Uncharacterized protein n=1 Tax=Brassica campestris TaxID=3711 RepID=A0A3P5ZW58_BRACM|nr:unnamed protein product [Brassica rapa]VDC76711.1 unnamed protein product [Brassica rapa]